MNYLYDTNILIYLIKEHPLVIKLEQGIVQESTNLRMISIVSKAEMESLAIQRKWGEKRMELFHNLLNQFLIIPIDSGQIVKAYGEIDAFSQGTHPTIKEAVN